MSALFVAFNCTFKFRKQDYFHIMKISSFSQIVLFFIQICSIWYDNTLTIAYYHFFNIFLLFFVWLCKMNLLEEVYSKLCLIFNPLWPSLSFKWGFYILISYIIIDTVCLNQQCAAKCSKITFQKHMYTYIIYIFIYNLCCRLYWYITYVEDNFK